MTRPRLLRWIMLVPLSGGLLASSGCPPIVRDSVMAGLFEFVAGEVNSSFGGTLPIGDALASLLAGQFGQNR